MYNVNKIIIILLAYVNNNHYLCITNNNNNVTPKSRKGSTQNEEISLQREISNSRRSQELARRITVRDKAAHG